MNTDQLILQHCINTLEKHPDIYSIQTDFNWQDVYYRDYSTAVKFNIRCKTTSFIFIVNDFKVTAVISEPGATLTIHNMCDTDLAEPGFATLTKKIYGFIDREKNQKYSSISLDFTILPD